MLQYFLYSLKKVLYQFNKISTAVRLVLVCIIVFLAGDVIPESVQSFFYAVSLTLQSFLLFTLPFIIFLSVFSCLLNFRHQKTKGISFLISLLIVVCISNSLAIYAAYGIKLIIHPGIIPIHNLKLTYELKPCFIFNLPNVVSNDLALIIGFLGGSFFMLLSSELLQKFSIFTQRCTFYFGECINIILPIFIAGFLFKLKFEGALIYSIAYYVPLFVTIICSCSIYLFLILIIVSKFNLSELFKYLQNIFPVILMGLATTSSVACLSETLISARKNTENSKISELTIMTTVNIHTVGDCLITILIALTMLESYGIPEVSLKQYNYFFLYFLLAQFVMAGIPGGGILILLPVFEAHLGFTKEMSALFTALYLLMDPLITVVNLVGNSYLVIIISKLFKIYSKLNYKASLL